MALFDYPGILSTVKGKTQRLSHKKWQKNTHKLIGFLRISLNEDGSLDGWSALKMNCVPRRTGNGGVKDSSGTECHCREGL